MTSRLSTTSASRSLSGYLENSNQTSPESKRSSTTTCGSNKRASLQNIENTHQHSFQIHSSSPSVRTLNSPRLTMQSYFDKENKSSLAKNRSKKENTASVTSRTSPNVEPLRDSTSSSINRLSISNSLKTPSIRSFSTNTVNCNSITTTNNNNNIITPNLKSSRFSYQSSISNKSKRANNSNSIRKSIDTTSSGKHETETTNITDNLNHLHVKPTSTNNYSRKNHMIKSNRLSLNNEPSFTSFATTPLIADADDFSIKSIEIPVEEEYQHHFEDTNVDNNTDVNNNNVKSHNKKRSISSSASFRSLKNSLSMRTLTSTLKSDDNNVNNNLTYNDNPSSNSQKRMSLKSSKRKMSLENIRSFLSTRRSSIDTQNEYRNNISLPIMQPQTKDKIRNRLRNSNSIMSMSSATSSTDLTEKQPNTKMKPVDLDHLHYSLLLKLCNQSRATSFVSYLNKFQTLTPRKHLTKLSQTSKNFLFMEFSCENSSDSHSHMTPSGVWKVIPIDHNDENGTPITQIIQELTLTMLMSNKLGFVGINSAKVVSGPIPSSLLDLIDDINPFSQNQLYLIMRLDYAGDSLKNFVLESWKDAATILIQVLDALCLAENENYEHRDLNFENIMIKKSNKEIPDPNNPSHFTEQSYLEVTIIDHALARGVVSGQLMYRNLYDADFFRGSGEYRHTIYKLMRRAVNNSKGFNLSNSNLSSSESYMSINTLKTEISMTESHLASSDWSQSYPIFNLLWIHYLLKILLFEKGLKPLKMNPILKKKSWLVNGGEMGEENRIYEKLMQGYRMVEPAVLFGAKKNKYMREINNVNEFRDWYYGK